jgi:hypothetical protein
MYATEMSDRNVRLFQFRDVDQSGVGDRLKRRILA